MNEADPTFTWEFTSFLIFFFFVLGTIAVVIIWQSFATWRAKMLVAREDAYRALAAQSAAALEHTAGELARTKQALTVLETRTAEMERLLKEVG